MRDLYLQNLLASIILGATFWGVYTLHGMLHPRFLVLLDQGMFYRLLAIAATLLLYGGVPVLVYTGMKWYLLPELGVTRPLFVTFLMQQYALFGTFLILYLVWDFIGGGLRTDGLFAQVILLAYGSVLAVVASIAATYTQWFHRLQNRRALVQLYYYWREPLWLLGIMIAMGVLSYLMLMHLSIAYTASTVAVIGLAAYTWWQQRQFTLPVHR